MTEITWDQVGERLYETGVDKGVLYQIDNAGDYVDGVPWNGLTTVTESPSGAEANKQYADNTVYLNLVSAEEFGGTIEAFTYPEEFGQNDGTADPVVGVALGQQGRRPFGLAYRTLIGNDLDGTDHGYKLHFVYGAQASPSEKAFATINDSPEAISLSWEFTTTPVAVTGHKPSALLTIDSTKVDADALADLEDIIYGTDTGRGLHRPRRRRDQRGPDGPGQPADVRRGHRRHHAAERGGRAVEGQRRQQGPGGAARSARGSGGHGHGDGDRGPQPPGRRRLDVPPGRVVLEVRM
jgi:hypothetical protein